LEFLFVSVPRSSGLFSVGFVAALDFLIFSKENFKAGKPLSFAFSAKLSVLSFFF